MAKKKEAINIREFEMIRGDAQELPSATGAEELTLNGELPSAQDKDRASRKERKTGAHPRPSDELDEEGKELFERLRTVRREIAGEEKVPPYIVFADRTLVNMIQSLPQDMDQMLTVSGVGPYKLSRYGQRFLDEICRKAAG